ncbi:MAG: hypothetical protein ACOX6Y_06705 [Christensenellales bacterium]|jgi:hypothetical protein
MKKLTALVLAFVTIAAIALAAGSSLTIQSSQTLEEQFEAFRAYLDSLPADKRAAWMAEMTSITEEEQTKTALSGGIPAAAGEETMVWVSKSGKKYHAVSTCSNMKNPSQVTRAEALRRGLEPCKRCKPQ